MIDLSSLKTDIGNKSVAIMGLGKSGTAAYEACNAVGIKTIIWDSNQDALQKLKDKGANIENLEETDFSKVALLCLAPGIPFTNPEPHAVVKRAQAAGVEVISDIELLYRARPNAKFVGITGSNGKSTTTALVGHIIKEAGLNVEVGGNIGNAALSLNNLGDDGIYVLELSSYQLDLCEKAPNISAFINISPDHLDRHGGLQGYIKAKERIFFGKGVAVIGVDDEYSKEVAVRQKTKGDRTVIEVTVADDFDMSGCETLKGNHNKQNAMIAFEICKALGIDENKIKASLRTFPGLEHRQKLVKVINGVSYVNDSKATNDDATAKALASFKNIYWIAGGKSKNAGYEESKKYFANVRAAFLIGAAAEEIAEVAKSSNIPTFMCQTMDKALLEAKKLAESSGDKNAVVLLSPACASFDQFKSFEHRGDVFIEEVKKLG